MIRLLLLLGILGTSNLITHAQYVVYKDANGQIFTSFDTYSSNVNLPAHNQIIYKDSPFLTYPVWQEGKVQLDKQGGELACQLAYNLFTNEVMCRFAGDSAIKLITPEVFTLNGVEFVRQLNSIIGNDYRMYSTVLYNGQTKLLMSLSKQLVANYSSNSGYDKDDRIKGTYKTKTTYYVRKGNARPELINLSKKSLLTVLYDQVEKIGATLPDKQLTTDEVIEALKVYDTLIASTQAHKSPLSNDAVFNQALHDKLIYPGQAWNQGIYGRVYGGFEIDDQGRVKNIVLLSPDNGGVGFGEAVKKALEKLPRVDPALQGRYALPVAFTYTNSQEKAAAHVPINRLPVDRLDNRTELEEVVIPIVVSKPVITSKEVWGYYK